jgi:hypothetical protein
MNEARAFAFWSFYVVVIAGLVLISTSLPTKVGPTWGRREKKSRPESLNCVAIATFLKSATICRSCVGPNQ